VRHVARMGIAEVRTEFWWGNIRERENLEDIDAEGGTFLKGFLWNTMGRRALDYYGSGYGQASSRYEYS